ncbi:sporulation protein YqfD [Clostridium sp. DL1XJH146]
MSKFNFEKYKNGRITIQVSSIIPEKFINLLWKNNIEASNLQRINTTTFNVEINLKDYGKIGKLVSRGNAKIKIIDRKGVSFFFLKLSRRRATIIGIILFVSIIYLLSGYVWNIDINTEKHLTPFEVENYINSLGIEVGVKKNKIESQLLEDKLISDIPEIMWARVTMDGSNLIIDVIESRLPPNTVVDNEPCNIIADKDGIIEQVYASSGTVVVEKGQVVQKGDVLIKGIQGKEDATYEVHAEGEIVAKTFYEKKTIINKKEIIREKTGNEAEDLYIKLGNKEILIKKSDNKYEDYDKDIIDKPLYKKIVYYEVEEKEQEADTLNLEEAAVKELNSNIVVNLDKSVKIIDKIVNKNDVGNMIELSVIIVCEEEIGIPRKSEVSSVND